MLVCCNCCVGPSLSHNNTQSSQLLHPLTAAAVYFRHNIAMQPAGIDMSIMLMKERFYIYSWKLDSVIIHEINYLIFRKIFLVENILCIGLVLLPL